MKPLDMILASQSPRRATLLRQGGYRFRIRKPEIQEDLDISDPVSHVMTLASRKAEAVRSYHPAALVVAADTVVFHRNQILGKPGDPQEATAMLSALSGMTHQVFTGFVILHPDGRCVSDCVSTDVTFRQLEPWEINLYVATGEPYDKAGGYGIQGRAGLFVSEIRGCFYNVVGFPLSRFHSRLVELIGPQGVLALMRDGRYSPRGADDRIMSPLHGRRRP